MFLENIYWNILGGILSPGNEKGKLSIITYHSVLEEDDLLCPGSICKNDFERVIAFLSLNFNILPLKTAVELWGTGRLPPRSVCITFDDGYADNCDIVLPILRKHSIEATFFITTGFLDGGIMWNDSIIESVRQFRAGSLNLSELGLGVYSTDSLNHKADAIQKIINQLKHLDDETRHLKVKAMVELTKTTLPDNLMMTEKQVVEMRDAGMDIGGHTINHPILNSINDDQAWREILGGKERLEQIIGDDVTLFAYPNGKTGIDYSSRHVEMIKKAGFKAAVTTEWGCTGKGAVDVYQLSRFTPWDKTPFKYGMRMLRNCMSC